MFDSSERPVFRCGPGGCVLIVTALIGAFLSGCGAAKAPTKAPTAGGSTSKSAVPSETTGESPSTLSGIAKPIVENSAGVDSNDPTRFVPADAFMFALLRPRRIMDSAVVKGLPPRILEEATKRFRMWDEVPVELELSQVDRILVVAVPDRRPADDPSHNPKEKGILVFRTHEAMDEVGLVGQRQAEGTEIREANRDGRRYWRFTLVGPDEQDDPARTDIVLWLDDKTLITGNEAIVFEVVSGVRPGSIAGLLKGVSLDQDLVIAGLPNAGLTQFAKAQAEVVLPREPAEQLKEAVDQARSILVTANLGGGDLVSISVDAASEDAANSMALRMGEGRQELEETYKAFTAGFRGDDAPPMKKEATAFADTLLAGLSTAKTGNRVSIKVGNPGGWEKLAAALKPAFEKAEAAARESWKLDTLRRIVLAFHNYESSNARLPPEDPSGRGLSWRVHLLAELGERELFAKFKLDEPWDSEHNKALIDQMPKMYASSDVEEPGRTRFLGFSGEGAPHGRDRGLRFRDITDGESRTLLVVEVAPEKAMIWTQPDDLKFDPKDPKAALGNLTTDTFLAAFVDGSVRRLSRDIKPEALRAMITYAGGESPSNDP